MGLIQNTQLYHQKTKFPELGTDNREIENTPFQRYQNDLRFGDDEYLSTNINKQGEVSSLKMMYKDYLKEQNLRNKLIFKGAIQDMEILADESADYFRFYDKNNFESYGY